MPANPHPESVSQEALARRHESQDPPVRGILLVVGLVLLTMLGCLAVIWVLMHSLSARRPAQPAQDPGLLTAPGLEPSERFPAPRLQLVPRQELLALAAREDCELTNYGWLDRAAGVVRIPVTRAMDLIAQRGLPTAGTNGAHVAGKSSLELIQERSLQR